MAGNSTPCLRGAAMTHVYSFHIPGEPVAFARSGGHGTIRFTPKKQRDFMALVKLAAATAMAGEAPIDGPVEVIIRAVYSVPASWPKKRRDAARWRASKPDVDNIGKIVADAMNEIVYRDDAQIASLLIQQTYGCIVGVTVTVSALDEGGDQ